MKIIPKEEKEYTKTDVKNFIRKYRDEHSKIFYKLMKEQEGIPNLDDVTDIWLKENGLL